MIQSTTPFDMYPEVVVEQSERLFPEDYHNHDTVVTKLSILDANVVNWSVAAATWYLDAPCTTLTTSHLRTTLRKTLALYPQWCGKLSVNIGDSTRIGHDYRDGRIEVRYYHNGDPGVGFITARCPVDLASVIPSAAERTTTHASWLRDDVPSTTFSPTEPIVRPVHDPPEANNSGMLVQITRFSCDSLAVTIELAHCLADAHALVHFAKNWAAISRRTLDETSTSTVSQPLFMPSLLDGAIAGDVNEAKTSAEILEQYAKLPCRPYDHWTSHSAAPWPVYVPKQYIADADQLSGILMPWSTWDTQAPCKLAVIHFTPAQLRLVHSIASSTASSISMHDALLGHIWASIARARKSPVRDISAQENGSEDPFYCYLTLALRPQQRLNLGDAFLGSPIIHTAVTLPAATLAAADRKNFDSPAAKAALAMRSAVSCFTPAAIGVFLHRIAFELTPQRLWHAFLGSRHTIMTSWVWAGVYDVDFTGTDEGRIRYAEGIMPLVDGVVQILEGTAMAGNEAHDEAGKWWRNGVDVSLTLEATALERLLGDEYLLPGMLEHQKFI